ncbi:mitochondrial import receptor subunit TOM70 [Galendromus occidentalis]|uniref:Mitochondrial import receptor subunit TOM70 n=1 Tax=Galendromus occidentalis TaxID=34638 RepID=A0AAJ6VXM4_9ACAR|nr:mitochondrial import receptor subunit TOM70 [Galendromus occidentalis]
MTSTALRAVPAEVVNDTTSDSKLRYIIMFGAPLVAGIALYWYMGRRTETKNKVSSVPKKDIRAEAQKKIDDQINSQDPKERATGFKNKGNNLFKVRKYKEAIECYSEAIKVCPIDKVDMLSTFYQNRAAAYENLNMVDNVLQDCTKAIELNNKYSKAYFRRAKAFEEKGELQKCVEDATVCAVLEQFQHANALQLADKVLKSFASQRAKEIFSTRKPDLPASSFIRNFLKSFCEDPVIHDLEAKRRNEPSAASGPPSGYDLALQDLLEEKWDQVEGHCTEEIRQEHDKEKLEKALLLRAGLCVLSGRIDDAERDVDTLLSRENVNVKVRVNALIKKATAEVHREQYEQALATFEKAVGLDPNNADIYLHRGQIYLLLDQVDQTLRNLELSASLRPDFVSANAQLAYSKYNFGKRFNDAQAEKEARAMFKTCMEKFPNAAEVYFLYAQLFNEQQQLGEAEKYFKKFIELEPRDALGWVHLGIVTVQSGQRDKGVEMMMKAIEIEPKCQFAYETLSTFLMQIERSEEAVKMIEKGIELAQSEGEIAHLIALKLSSEVQNVAMQRLGN